MLMGVVSSSYPSVVTPVVKKKYLLDGTNEFIDCGSPMPLGWNDSITEYIEVKFNSLPTNIVAFLGSGIRPDNNNRRYIYYEKGIDSLRLIFRGTSTSNNLAILTGSLGIIAGSVLKIAYTYDGTKLAAGVKMYNTSGLIATTVYSDNLNADFRGTPNNFLGSLWSYPAEFGLDGEIMRYGICSGVLTAGEISTILGGATMKSVAGAATQQELLFDNDVWDAVNNKYIVKDTSGNGRDGFTVNMEIGDLIDE